MDESRSDIVMRFVMKGGGPVWAESTLDVLKEDPLMHGFKPISSYDDYSNFFEVTSFSFAVAVKPKEEGVGALSRGTGTHGANGGNAPAAQDQFSRWRSATEEEYRKIRFPLEFDTFTFTRVIDGASPTFFSACCNQESFESAALVKRVASGVRGGTSRESFGYLRLDFKDVLFTGISWDDGDLVTERCTFICKAMRVRYRQQKADSSLLPAIETVWDQQKDGRADAAGGS
jgi:type VI protein secretion system component Hcp